MIAVGVWSRVWRWLEAHPLWGAVIASVGVLLGITARATLQARHYRAQAEKAADTAERAEMKAMGARFKVEAADAQKAIADARERAREAAARTTSAAKAADDVREERRKLASGRAGRGAGCVLVAAMVLGAAAADETPPGGQESRAPKCPAPVDISGHLWDLEALGVRLAGDEQALVLETAQLLRLAEEELALRCGQIDGLAGQVQSLEEAVDHQGRLAETLTQERDAYQGAWERSLRRVQAEQVPPLGFCAGVGVGVTDEEEITAIGAVVWGLRLDWP